MVAIACWLEFSLFILAGGTGEANDLAGGVLERAGEGSLLRLASFLARSKSPGRHWHFASEKCQASTHFSTGRMPVAPSSIGFLKINKLCKETR
jgi:hypothetical protein